MKSAIQLDQLQLGVCYYPEQWSESLWEDDLRRMRELHISVIRIAEFAWSAFEPEEGVFTYELFDKVMDLAHQYGIQVIIGTPTATPPAWLTHKYPEVLNATQDGLLMHHGMRKHCNLSSPKFRELSARITRKIVEHYKDHPALIGWQIDNELNCEVGVYYAEADHAAFRAWVKNKYCSLEELNRAWGTVFWNQQYTDWEQVYLPRRTPNVGSVNPHQALDEKRFVSDNTISYVKLQADIIRELDPNHWVTTNGLFGHLDNHEMTEQLLDFMSYDSYPQFGTLADHAGESNPLRDRAWSFNLSCTRSISSNFCVMEQQAGPGGWVNRMQMPSPRPDQMRLWTYQSILHGTDLLIYFRWRTAVFGTEMYWHGLNDHHNQDNRRLREAEQIGKEVADIGRLIAGTKYAAHVAIVRDYDNLWDGEMDVMHGPLEWKSVYAWYKQLQLHHIPADVLYMRSQTTLEELQHYHTLIYPHPAIMTEETASLLEQYVQSGGRVIFGTRTAYKNIDGHCNMAMLPGPVAALCGITVQEYTLVNSHAQAPALHWLKDSSSHGLHLESLTADAFNDVLKVEHPDVEIIAEYASDYYAGSPALTRKPHGLGEAWYFGAVYNEAIVERIIDQLKWQSPAADWLELPPQVELGIRVMDQKQYVFLLNYSQEPALIHVRKPCVELLSGAQLTDNASIPAYGVWILTE